MCIRDRSWGSVFGGVMTVLAISVLLSILNSSIGLFMFDPLSDHPVAGIGTAVGIGSAIILVAGMAAGGFVAGKLAGMDGMIHGFLVWATTLIVAVVLGIFLAVGAAKMTVNTLGAVSYTHLVALWLRQTGILRWCWTRTSSIPICRISGLLSSIGTIRRRLRFKRRCRTVSSKWQSRVIRSLMSVLRL